LRRNKLINGEKDTGIIFNIQRYTIHDGPGIRTEIFLKGCPLKCKWCSNPEGMNPYPQIALRPLKCIGIDLCGQCLEKCHLIGKGSIKTEEKKVISIDRRVCDNCLACADVCPSDALSIYGKHMSVSEVMEIVLADRDFYGQTGGVTFSGGEAYMQHRFLLKCLAECKGQGIHICVESALMTPLDRIIETLPFIDLMICDIKVMDADKHKKYTGQDNLQILHNMTALAQYGIPMVIRIPVIPYHNCDTKNIIETARFIRTNLHDGVHQVQLLRFRRLGVEKYDALGMAYGMADVLDPKRAEAEARIKELAEIMREQGVPAVAGTTTPF